MRIRKKQKSPVNYLSFLLNYRMGTWSFFPAFLVTNTIFAIISYWLEYFHLDTALLALIAVIYIVNTALLVAYLHNGRGLLRKLFGITAVTAIVSALGALEMTRAYHSVGVLEGFFRAMQLLVGKDQWFDAMLETVIVSGGKEDSVPTETIKLLFNVARISAPSAAFLGILLLVLNYISLIKFWRERNKTTDTRCDNLAPFRKSPHGLVSAAECIPSQRIGSSERSYLKVWNDLQKQHSEFPQAYKSGIKPPVFRGNFSEPPNNAFDAVDCTLFSPPFIKSNDSIMVQVFIHRTDEEFMASIRATEFDDEATKRGVTSLGTCIAIESILDFELVIPSLIVEPKTCRATWRGRIESIQFEVKAPKVYEEKTLIGRLIVSQNRIPIGGIRFKLKLKLSTEGSISDTIVPMGEAVRYKKAFISYASKDRDEVLRRVQMLNSVGIEFFQDIINMNPGERWEKGLYKNIDLSDVMFLFWSKSAKESKWVEKEWRYGLGLRGLDFIQPVIIEGPPIIPPPKELSGLHFSDRIIYFLEKPI